MIENLNDKENVRDGEVLNPLLPQNPPPVFLSVTDAKPPLRHQSNEIMPVRKLIKCAKICGIVSVLAVVLIVVTALLTHRPVAHVISDPFQTNVESSLSHILIESLKDQRDSLIFTETYSTSIRYLSMSIPYKPLSRKDDPQSERCQFSHFAVKSRSEKDMHRTHKQICFEFEDQIQAAIYETDVYKGLECYVVNWYSQNSKNSNPSIVNCISMNTDNWYGGGSLSIHRWPLNRVNVSTQPFITRQFDKTLSSKTDAHFTSFLEPYFISSKGAAVIPESNIPLFVSINENGHKQICLKSSLKKPFNKVSKLEDNGIHLNYTVCKGSSAKAVHQQLLETGSLPHPKQHPKIEVLQKPVWSTQGQNISNEINILTFAKNIKNFSVNFSQLFIDGNYTKSAGNFYFNEKKFPHSAQLIMELDEQLPEKKLKVSTQVYPIIPEYISDKNFSFNSIQNSNGGYGPFLLDVFCEKACEWYISQLKDIQKQIHVNGFRFSGGEVASFLKHDGSMKSLNITKKYSFNEITTQYSNVASQFQDGSFLGSGYRSQIHGMVADVGPFLSSWDHRKGLKSIIPTVITSGLIGYPFVSAGPVGGVNVNPQNFSLPSENLYLRWLQLSIHLPVIELSVGPWEYGPAVVKYARSLLEYRQNVLWPQYLSAAVKEAVDVGTPIIRPLWWIAPDDFTAQFIDCEFLVSNHLLVAPILNPYQTARGVYLPKGHWWQDLLHNKLYKGGQWLYNFPVDTFQIATFAIKASPRSTT